MRVPAIELSYSPRDRLIDPRHVRTLLQIPTPLAPIVIHEGTGCVIDGAHRVRAAQVRGERSISAQFFAGSAIEAFILAVHLNTVDGLPLALRERRTAAYYLLAHDPARSDRAVGRLAGLSNKTVATLRAQWTGQTEDSRERIGHDGETAPADAAERRQRAAQYLIDNPSATPRQVAHHAGISPSAAGDVRARLRAGSDPLPRRLVDSEAEKLSGTSETARTHQKATDGARQRRRSSLAASANAYDALFQRLTTDPMTQSSERGRYLVRQLHVARCAASACHVLADTLPAHCWATLAELAQQNARAWTDIEAKLIGMESRP